MKQVKNHIWKALLIYGSLITSLFILSGCQKDLGKTEKDMSVLNEQQASLKNKNEIVVHTGNSIQAAVDAAVENTTIKIEPGVYKESIVVNKPHISILGEGDVIIENPGDEENGITVTDNGDGFILKNVTVENFEKNGVFLIRVDGFLLSHVNAVDNGDYGLFPVFSSNGVIEHCTATGHSDTGVYVGQSTDIALNHNTANANVNGLEIENCSRVTADKNHCYDNVAGILVVLLPGLRIKESADIIITKNQIHDNNHVNFATPGEGFEGLVPSGSGILVVGTDRTTVEDNHISGNNFVGVAVVSTVILGSIGGIPPEAFQDIEPNPDGTKIINNKLENNGGNPPNIGLPGVDLLWDGNGNGNCWSKNNFKSSYPSPLPACS